MVLLLFVISLETALFEQINFIVTIFSQTILQPFICKGKNVCNELNIVRQEKNNLEMF